MKANVRKIVGTAISSCLPIPMEDLIKIHNELERLDGKVKRLEKVLSDRCNHDAMDGLIQANRDAILKMHEEAVSLIGNLTRSVGSSSFSYEFAKKVEAVIHALNLFHPMHGESWPGWPTVEAP